MKIIRFSLLALLTLTAAFADIDYNVTLDTSPLMSSTAGPFSIGFEFADGSGTGDGNNAVIMTGFNFGAGSASGSPLTFGSAGGDMASAVVMTDATPVNIFVESLVPGNTLSFDLHLTTNIDADSTPDEFIMSILDNTFSPIPTLSLSPLSPFIQIDIDSANPTVQIFGSDPNQSPAGGGGPISIGQPTVTASAVAPEPSTFVVSFLIILILIWEARRRTRGAQFFRK